jgi:hypothetical protein
MVPRVQDPGTMESGLCSASNGTKRETRIMGARLPFTSPHKKDYQQNLLQRVLHPFTITCPWAYVHERVPKDMCCERKKDRLEKQVVRDLQTCCMSPSRPCWQPPPQPRQQELPLLCHRCSPLALDATACLPDADPSDRCHRTRYRCLAPLRPHPHPRFVA